MAAAMARFHGLASRQTRGLLIAQHFPSKLTSIRFAASAASSKVVKIVQGELKHEQSNYEQAKEVAGFLKSSNFKLEEAEGDVNMTLKREVGGKTVKIEWQLTSPFDADAEEDGEDGSAEATELSISAEDNTTGRGMIFYCSTQPGDDHRYVIGNIKTYDNAEERDSMSGYNGPEFEDLDDKLQEAFDEYLAELGMTSEVCDFIDAMALDKEQREYIRWLTTAKSFLDH